MASFPLFLTTGDLLHLNTCSVAASNTHTHSLPVAVVHLPTHSLSTFLRFFLSFLADAFSVSAGLVCCMGVARTRTHAHEGAAWAGGNMGGDGSVCVDTAQRQHIQGGGERSSSEPERKEGCVGAQNSRPLGHRVCLCMCQTKAVLPKRCLGVSFVPNPNALSRFVLAFVCFVVVSLLFCDRLVDGGCVLPFSFSSLAFAALRCLPCGPGCFFAGWFCVCVFSGKEHVHVVL